LKLTAPLEGRRVLVREHVESDLEAFHAWRGDRGVMQFLSWSSRSLEESRASLAEAIAEQSRPDRTRYYFAVVRRDGGAIAGDVGLDLRGMEEAGLGWFLLPEHQGLGLATEAARLLIRFGFETLGLRALVASCDAENRRSEHVMQQCGMSQVGDAPRCSRAGRRLFYRLEEDF
jgi:ribosomal-protein-alanine N-acetyltransferase